MVTRVGVQHQCVTLSSSVAFIFFPLAIAPQPPVGVRWRCLHHQFLRKGTLSLEWAASWSRQRSCWRQRREPRRCRQGEGKPYLVHWPTWKRGARGRRALVPLRRRQWGWHVRRSILCHDQPIRKYRCLRRSIGNSATSLTPVWHLNPMRPNKTEESRTIHRKHFFCGAFISVFQLYFFEKKSLLAVRKIEGQRPYPKSTHGNGMGTG